MSLSPRSASLSNFPLGSTSPREPETNLAEDFESCLSFLRPLNDVMYGAVGINSKDLAFEIISKNPRILQFQDQEGHTIIHRLVLENEIDVDFWKKVKEHFKEFDINSPSTYGEAPLHLAIRIFAGREDVNLRLLIEKLVELGANVNKADAQGVTPLHYATECEALSILQLLYKNKADVNAQDMEGNTPLHYAVKFQGGSKPSLPCQPDNPTITIIQTLCQAGASPNIQNKQGQTPLHIIISEANTLYCNGPTAIFFTKTIRTLLDIGASEMMFDHRNQTPVDIDHHGLLKTLSATHPITTLSFTGDVVKERSPSLENTSAWENIPMFSILTGRNGSGKTEMVPEIQTVV